MFLSMSTVSSPDSQTRPAPLPDAPERPVDVTGAPRYGTYAGTIDRIDYAPFLGRRGLGRMHELFHRKRWVYCSIWNEAVIVVAAIIDAGYAGSGFAYLFSRAQRRFLYDKSLVTPPRVARVGDVPGMQLEARLRLPSTRLQILRGPGQSVYQVRVDLGDSLRLDASLDMIAGPPAVSAVCEVRGGSVNTTIKSHLLPVQGEVRSHGERFVLDGAHGAIDYTNGLMHRNTVWQWVSASGTVAGRPVALNLVDKFNEGRENVLWIDGEPRQIGRAHIEFSNTEPMRPWKISTECGSVDLRFAPQGVRTANTRLPLVISQYIQPVGAFAGTIRDHEGRSLEVNASDLTGVTEDHLARW
jgi:hypothetical protein